ncbi:unnamed protein product [Owenia fusiformis]|uniref:Uncharacterized protein n=1 Tax=Owenia fusiformis TaxID=6347 RepID=A0A8J1UA57_OWEFU|nr:unnamed protein product [Owenia fusiformis]
MMDVNMVGGITIRIIGASLSLVILLASVNMSRSTPQTIDDPIFDIVDAPDYVNFDQGPSCEERSKCETSDSSGFRNDTAAFLQRNCYCDKWCAVYGDCCKSADIESLAQQFPAGVQLPLPKEIFTCARMPDIPDVGTNHVYVIGKCPRHFRRDNPTAAAKCESKDDKDPEHTVPVSGKQNGFLYKNVFCAMCNGLEQSDISFWQASIDCDELKEYKNRTLHDIIEQNKGTCFFTYTHSEYSFTFCKRAISKCAKGIDRKLKKKCQKKPISYTYAKDTSWFYKVYKNEHCALCNNEELNNTRCQDPDSIGIIGFPFGEGHESEDPLSSFPFSILLDLNSGGGMFSSAVGSVTGEITKERVEYKSCPNNEVYNLFTESCKEVVCYPGFVLENGLCVRQLEDNVLELMTTESASSTTPLSTTANDATTASSTKPPTTTQNLIIIESDLKTSSVMLDSNYNDDTPSIDINEPRDYDVTTTRKPRRNRPKNRKDRTNKHKAERPTEDARIDRRVNYSLPDDCPKLPFNDTEYIRFPNQTIYIYAMESFYSTGEYDLFGGLVFICSELTQNFSIRQNVTVYMAMFKFSPVQDYVSMGGLIISLIALFIFFLIYLLVPPLRNVPGQCLMCLVFSLFIAQLLFLVGVGRTDIWEVCYSIAVAMHYFFLASFFWTNVLAFDICMAFSGKGLQPAHSTSGTCRFALYSLYAWLSPAVIVGTAVTLDFFVDTTWRPNYADNVCWITYRPGLLVFFAAPLAALVFINIILYCVTSCHIYQTMKATRKVIKSSNKRDFILYVKLCLIMGLTWLFGFLATLVQLEFMWYVFIVFNTLQGLFLCLAFTCTKTVCRHLCNCCGEGKGGKQSSNGSTKMVVISTETAL